MKKFASYLVGIDAGEIVLFDHFVEEGPMWFGDGAREVVEAVTFSEAFTDLPHVSVHLVMWDMAQGTNARIDLGAQNVSTRGFEVRLRTWADTRIARVRVAWQAIGPVRDDELWDIA